MTRDDYCPVCHCKLIRIEVEGGYMYIHDLACGEDTLDNLVISVTIEPKEGE
jgi:hypothetical protein